MLALFALVAFAQLLVSHRQLGGTWPWLYVQLKHGFYATELVERATAHASRAAEGLVMTERCVTDQISCVIPAV